MKSCPEEVAYYIWEHFAPGEYFIARQIRLLHWEWKTVAAAMRNLELRGYLTAQRLSMEKSIERYRAMGIKHLPRRPINLYRRTDVLACDLAFHRSLLGTYTYANRRETVIRPAPEFRFTLLEDTDPGVLRARVDEHLDEAVRLERLASVQVKSRVT